MLDEGTTVAQLSSQYPFDLIGVAGGPILLSWKVSSTHDSAKQVAYRIQVSEDSNFTNVLAETSSAGDQQVGIEAPGGTLSSRQVLFYRVSIETEYGVTDWSPSLRCEAGLLEASDWVAKAIGDDSKKESPSPLLRKEFALKGEVLTGRLYVTSMGINTCYINGKRVGDHLLSPGWTAYENRLIAETFDVTDLLAEGANCLGAELSDGWWRGKFGFMEGSEHYGTEIGLIAQLEVEYVDGSREVIATDESWKCSSGEIRFSSIYDGSVIDYSQSQIGWNKPGFDSSHWSPVLEKQLDVRVLAQPVTNPVRVVGEFPMTIEHQEDRLLLRGVQNISGWVKLEIDGKKGQKVTVRHAEVLEPGDKLHVRALRTAKATDVYILGDDGHHVLEPVFTFHGFQHADVVTEATVLSATAVAISSDLERRGNFECSNELLNRLHENVVWSQLDNFVSIPTDCPQRDERLGWTGDAQAFCSTANTLYKTESFWRSWLIDLEIEQHESGAVPAVVPDLLKFSPALDGWITEGRAGWADAATIVPMSVFEYFGDESILKQQLSSMRRWVDEMDVRRGGDDFLPTQFQFGDWCDPDAPGDRPWEAKVSSDYVANAFFAHSAELLAQAETLVGSAQLAEKYSAIANDLKAKIWAKWGLSETETTAGCAIALKFEIVPGIQRQEIADKLAKMVADDAGKITTGFLATPLILHALSENGHIREAYTMLMRTEFRSWLYAVEKGATTIWERWDAIREDGSIHTGAMDMDNEGQEDSSMISFNHYAYGAVVDWIYRNVGGISPVVNRPGFKSVKIAPKPPKGMGFAKSSIDTSYGVVSIEWKIDNHSDFLAVVKVPFGVTAEIELPLEVGGEWSCNGAKTSGPKFVEHGVYDIHSNNVLVQDF